MFSMFKYVEGCIEKKFDGIGIIHQNMIGFQYTFKETKINSEIMLLLAKVTDFSLKYSKPLNRNKR